MIYKFGEFELDSQIGSLRGPRGVVPLRRQAFRLCEVLLANAPNLLSHDEILDAVWGRSVVSANVLPQTISELRQALGDNPQSPLYIETLHRRGYRIVCSVEKLESPDGGVIRDPESGPQGIDGQGTPAARRSYLPTSRGSIALAVVLALLAAWLYLQWEARETLYTVTIPRIRETVDGDVFEAWREARTARQAFPDEAGLEQLMLDLTIPFSLRSEPSAATVLVGPYNASDDDWVRLGDTPLEGVRLPVTMLRFRVSKPGFVDLDVAPGTLPPLLEPFRLRTEAETPPGMVFVPGGSVTYMGQTRTLADFWIQRNEVSNREYLEFVEAGGYRRPEFWTHPIVLDGSTLSSEEIAALFTDATGFPGPASWALGTYPPDKAEHPVEGVSWYEAAAYASFKGQQLPTAFHWWRAAGRGGAREAQFASVVSASNFNGSGTWSTGAGGLGPYGTRDMAGNVGEWCANASGSARHFLGGSWLSEAYAFSDAFAQPAFDRKNGFGFRLMFTGAPIPEEQRLSLERRELEPATPVGDETFGIFARQYRYDSVPLNARTEHIDTSQRSWTRERISFDAAYGDERVVLELLLPNNAEPPFQTVVHFPGGDALLLDSIADAGLLSVEPFLRSGRAVAYPVYQGTFERKIQRRPGPLALRRLLIEQVQDVSRTLDYLRTRDDIAYDKIAFHGLSYGAIRAPFVLAIEKRFATALILSGGIPPVALPPEITLENYLPRVTLPTLFVTGRNDFNYRYHASQLPFFEYLGAPAGQKKHVVFEGGHLPTGYSRLQREVLAWLDETLGGPAATQK